MDWLGNNLLRDEANELQNTKNRKITTEQTNVYSNLVRTNTKNMRDREELITEDRHLQDAIYFDKIYAAKKQYVATWQQCENYKKSWQHHQQTLPQFSSGTRIPLRHHLGNDQATQWRADNLPQQSSSSSNWQSSWFKVELAITLERIQLQKSIINSPPQSWSSFVKHK